MVDFIGRVAVLALLSGGAVFGADAASADVTTQDLSLEPQSAAPARSVRIVGAPAEPDSMVLNGRFEGLKGADGEPFPLLTQRDRSGELHFLVPLPPHSDEPVALLVQLENIEPRPTPLKLEIVPLEPAPGATMKLVELASETLAIEAERAGVSAAELDTRLEHAPETIPAHLLPIAIARALTALTRERLSQLMETELSEKTDFSPEQIDSLVSSWGLVDMLRKRRDWASSQPGAPTGTDDRQLQTSLARLVDWLVLPAHAVTKPWEKLDIDTASELHYWMQRRLEYIERTPPGSKERKSLPEEIRKDLTNTARESAKEFAEGYFKEEKKQITGSIEDSTGKLLGNAKKFKRYKKVYGKVMGAAGLGKDVIDTTITFNDRMRIALLPSTLVKLDLQLKPAVFTEEDDIRGTPGYRPFGTIDAQLEARSNRFEFDLSDAIEIASLGFAASKQAKSDSASGGSGAKDAYKLMKRIADKVDIIREEARSRRHSKLSEAGNLWVVEPYRWRVHQVEEPKYSVLTLIPSGKAAVSVFAFPTAHNPVRWGYRPLAARHSTLRLRTAANKFPGALPVATEAVVEVKAIDAKVRPKDPDMKPKETRTFECPLEYVDKEQREWRAKDGTLEDRCLYGTCPTAEWTAPKLKPDECKRKAVLACEAMTEQGIRAGRNPPRVGTSTIRVRRPGPLAILPQAKRVAPDEPVDLKAQDSEKPVEWRLLEGAGKLEPTGPYAARFISEQQTTATIEAFVPREKKSCRPTAVIRVGGCRPTVEEEMKYGTNNGEFQGSLLGARAKTFKWGEAHGHPYKQNFAKIHIGGKNPPVLAIKARRNDYWSFAFNMPLIGQPLASGAFYQLTDSSQPWPFKPGVQMISTRHFEDVQPGEIPEIFTASFHDQRTRVHDDVASGHAAVRIEQLEWEHDRPKRLGPRGWACGTVTANYVAFAVPQDNEMGAHNVSYTVEFDFTASVETRGGSDWQRTDNKPEDQGRGRDKRERSDFEKRTDSMAEELGL